MMNPLTPKSTLAEVAAFVDSKPEESFCIDLFHNRETGQCCVMGHINKVVSGEYRDSSLDSKLRSKTNKFLMSTGLTKVGFQGLDLATVNNRKVGPYQQETPKARVMALLNDMLKAGIELNGQTV